MAKTKNIFDCLCEKHDYYLRKMVSDHNEWMKQTGREELTISEFVNNYALTYEKTRRKKKLQAKVNYFIYTMNMDYTEVFKTDEWKQLQEIRTTEEDFAIWLKGESK